MSTEERVFVLRLCSVLPEWPDVEGYRNVSGAQLHPCWTDITWWTVLQCLQRYVSVYDWLRHIIPPLLVRKVNTSSLRFAPSFLSSHLVCMLLGLITQPSWWGCRLRSSRYVNLPEPHCFGREVLQGKWPAIIQLIHRINRPQEPVIYTDTLNYTRWAEGVGSLERRNLGPGTDNRLLTPAEDFWELY